MSASADETEARELLAKYGTKIRKATHGDLWALPGNKVVMAYSEDRGVHGNWRAWKNTLADIKRALRAAGVKFEPQEPEKTDKKETPMASGKALTPPDLAKLGVHIQRKIRSIEEIDAVVDDRAVAILLGLINEGEKGTVVLLDAMSEPVTGPMTVRVTIERIEGES